MALEGEPIIATQTSKVRDSKWRYMDWVQSRTKKAPRKNLWLPKRCLTAEQKTNAEYPLLLRRLGWKDRRLSFEEVQEQIAAYRKEKLCKTCKPKGKKECGGPEKKCKFIDRYGFLKARRKKHPTLRRTEYNIKKKENFKTEKLKKYVSYGDYVKVKLLGFATKAVQSPSIPDGSTRLKAQEGTQKREFKIAQNMFPYDADVDDSVEHYICWSTKPLKIATIKEYMKGEKKFGSRKFVVWEDRGQKPVPGVHQCQVMMATA